MEEIETAVRRPRSQFPIHYEDNARAMLPHLSQLKRLSQMFSIRAQLRFGVGDSEGALDDVITALRLAESIKDEPFLICGLVRIAILNEALWPIWEGMSTGSWTAEQLKRLQDSK